MTAAAHQELLLAAMEAAQLGTWHRDPADDRIHWEGHAADLLATGDRATGFRRITEAILPDDRTRFLDALDEAQRSSRPFSLEIRVIRPSGEIRQVAIWGRPIRDDDGHTVRSVGVFRDITDERRHERQPARAHRIEASGPLAAGVAHGINTPLQYVGDNLRFLEDGFRQLAAFLHRQTEVLEQSAVVPAAATRLRRLAEEIDLDYLIVELPRALQQARDGVRRVGETVKSLAHPGSAAPGREVP